MPLVVVVGHPCSGKTTRVLALQAHLQSLGHEVMIINHESLNLSRASMYGSSEAEKKGRATFKSTLERFLSTKKVVIFDCLNYIKGYRYEMWCRAREVQTQHCTLFVNTPIETLTEWNNKRGQGDKAGEEKYDDKLLVDLCQRMETPNEEKRWDAPLFTVTPESEMPLDAIVDVLIKGKIPTINQAVVPAKLEDANYLFQLDSVTQEIVQELLNRQSESSSTMVGDSFSVPHASQKITLVRKIHLPELRRIQQQYLKVARIRTPDSIAAIANTFVEHVNMCLRQQGI